jgi:DNA-binding CsgD family transcriptional regulator
VASTTIIGRDQELDSIKAFLAGIEQGPAALILSGEPGIGKTILWEAGLEEAHQGFARVLSCRGVEAEASFAFAGLSELLAGVLDEVAPALAAPRRRALEVALLLADPGDQPPDAHMIGLSLLDVFGALAEQGPVLVALDDVQWLDASSATVLQVAVRRLREERIGVLATVRETPDAAVPFELESSFPGGRLAELSLDPLSLGALHDLIKKQLGVELTRGELVRVQQASRGNPFFALELARQGGRLGPGQALPVPGSLRTLLGERLARLPEETRDALLVIAAAGRATIDVIANAHRSGEAVEEALEPALREGVIEIDDSRVGFTHPLLASVCLQQVPPRRRRAVHKALVDAVSELEEEARHLALASEGPDAEVASRVDKAGEHAAARGAASAAAELCELAADLTPDPSPARQRRFRAARFYRLTGGRERAGAMLEQLLSEIPRGVERADVLFELAWTRKDSPLTIIELCDQALAEAGNDDARAARILSWRSWARICSVSARGALLDAQAALQKAERVGDPTLIAAAIARLGHTATWTGEPTREILEAGAEIEEREGLTLEYLESPRVALARLLVRLGELDRARAILEEFEAKAEARGDESTRAEVVWRLSLLEWLAGRWQRALGHAEVALELSEQAQDPHMRAHAGRFKAPIEADLGLVEEARASAEEAYAAAQAISNEVMAMACLASLGRVELLLGNLEAAGSYLREPPGRLLSGNVNDPVAPVWADAIETLVSLGELDLARTYIEEYEANAERLGSPYAIAGAARSRGLLAAAEGDLDAAFEAYQSALAELGELPYPLERGRTLLCLGSARRQAKQKRLARDALEEALAIFEGLGAPLWAEKARAELRRISGRRRASEEELTEMEERVATLAAEGRSNKEIAAELFVSVHTVSAHLSRTYRKLGIKSRGELAKRLTEAGATARALKPAR